MGQLGRFVSFSSTVAIIGEGKIVTFGTYWPLRKFHHICFTKSEKPYQNLYFSLKLPSSSEQSLNGKPVALLSWSLVKGFSPSY